MVPANPLPVNPMLAGRGAGQPEKFLSVGPEIGLADRISVIWEFIGHFNPGGNDLRGVAYLDHLGPEVIEGRQDPQVLKIPVIAMHPEVVPGQDHIGLRSAIIEDQRQVRKSGQAVTGD